MYIQQFFLKGLAHSSYLIGGNSSCAIVDPQREVSHYIETAESLGMEITHILLTHLHADFISGHMDLARLTGAVIYAPESANCAFKHISINEGFNFLIDDVSFQVLQTAGHTPEHITYVVTDKARGTEPVAIFCGDTLFVGDVGRPDLFPSMSRELAGKLFDNIHVKLMRLPDECMVFPAHGAGSLCGRALGAMRHSTIGYEKKYNTALQIMDRNEFIDKLTNNMPPVPDHFTRCSAINAEGPALISDMPALLPLTPEEFECNAQVQNATVIDIRAFDSFGGQHVEGSWNIDLRGNFATFAGWMINPERPILLVADNPEQAQEGARQLRKVGLDSIIGWLEGGVYKWALNANRISHVQQMSVMELHQFMVGEDPFTLLDVRTSREFEIAHIEGSVNIPLPEVRDRFGEISRTTPVIIICTSGQRSSIAASIMKQQGFEDVRNVSGGLTAYNRAGYAPECPVCLLPHGPKLYNI